METIDNISWEIREKIGILTLNSPPENYLARPAVLPLETLKRWTACEGLKGLLVYGAGKHFSGGGQPEHLFRMALSGENVAQDITAGKAVLEHLENLTIPVIAGIRGICFGGGLEIALACHIRFCAENALFAFPEVNHRILPGLAGTLRLTETTGFPRALTMILGGDMSDSTEALEMKLVDQIVPKSELFDHAFGLLIKMTHDRPLSVIHGVMNAMHNARNLSREEAMKEETRIFCMLVREEIRRTHENQEP